MERAELVFIPYEGVGHIVSMVEMAKLLVSRDERLSITVLIMKFPSDSAHNYQRSHSIPSRIRFIDLPLEDSDGLSNYPAIRVVDHHKPEVRRVVSELAESGSGSSRLAGLVIDMFCTAMVDVADEFGLPTYVFLPSSAGLLNLMFHLHTLRENFGHDVTELKESDAKLLVPGFSHPVPAKVLPSVALDKANGKSKMFVDIAGRYKNAKGILVNTFEELEPLAVKCLRDDRTLPWVYFVGPILSLGNNGGANSEAAIMKWLDDQPPASVVFLCFGSMGSFEEEEVKEIAHALEHGGHRFLWCLRRQGKTGDHDYAEEVLPAGFRERTAEIGRVIGWAPQVAVLSHRAVGGFISHCGWNSILEAVWCGVPVATWPLFAEQQINAFQLVRDLELAVEIRLDFRRDASMKTQGIVRAEEIENAIRRLMRGNESVRIRGKVKELSEKSRTAMREGGSSHAYLGNFIERVLNNVS